MIACRHDVTFEEASIMCLLSTIDELDRIGFMTYLVIDTLHLEINNICAGLILYNIVKSDSTNVLKKLAEWVTQ